MQQKIMWQNSLDVQFSWSKPAQNPGSLKSEETRLENFRAGQLDALASLVLFQKYLATVSVSVSIISKGKHEHGKGMNLKHDELFSCVTFSDTRAVFGATTGSILLGRVPSTRRRVHWVGPWPPSTSNNHRCIVGRRFVRSDVLATQSRAVFPESRVTFAGRRRRRKLNIADSDGPPSWRRGWSRGRGRSICDDVLC